MFLLELQLDDNSGTQIFTSSNNRQPGYRSIAASGRGRFVFHGFLRKRPNWAGGCVPNRFENKFQLPIGPQRWNKIAMTFNL